MTNGDLPVLLLTELLYANSAWDNARSHYLVFSPEIHRIRFSKAINHFCLAISLRMTSAAVIQGSVKTLPQSPPKVTNELGIPIRGDGLWHSMQTHNFVKEQIDHSSSIWILLHAMKWDIFEYLSTTTKTESIPCWVRGRPSIKSIDRSSHGAYGTGKGMYKLVFWDWPLVV